MSTLLVSVPTKSVIQVVPSTIPVSVYPQPSLDEESDYEDADDEVSENPELIFDPLHVFSLKAQQDVTDLVILFGSQKTKIGKMLSKQWSTNVKKLMTDFSNYEFKQLGKLYPLDERCPIKFGIPKHYLIEIYRPHELKDYCKENGVSTKGLDNEGIADGIINYLHHVRREKRQRESNGVVVIEDEPPAKRQKRN